MKRSFDSNIIGREHMARGKSINVYLMDGDVNGRIKCTLANWTGLAFKIPRTSLELCKDREELKQAGVYFLFGKDEQTEKNVIYVGQSGVRKNGEGILLSGTLNESSIFTLNEAA